MAILVEKSTFDIETFVYALFYFIYYATKFYFVIKSTSLFPEPSIKRSASMSNLQDLDKLPYIIKPCVQLNAKLKKKTPPRFKPLPIPNKWDNERSELLRQNAHYAAQLLSLKGEFFS